jgi:hypothetical protein
MPEPTPKEHIEMTDSPDETFDTELGWETENEVVQLLYEKYQDGRELTVEEIEQHIIDLD